MIRRSIGLAGSRDQSAIEPSYSLVFLFPRSSELTNQPSEAQWPALQNVIVGPTVPITPPTLEAVADIDGYRAHNMPALRNTQSANTLRLCAVTIPVALDAAGMPVGLQIIGDYFSEARLLNAAHQFQQVTDWHQREPQ